MEGADLRVGVDGVEEGGGLLGGGGEEEGALAGGLEVTDEGADGLGLVRGADEPDGVGRFEGAGSDEEAGEGLPVAGDVTGAEGVEGGDLGRPADRVAGEPRLEPLVPVGQRRVGGLDEVAAAPRDLFDAEGRGLLGGRLGERQRLQVGAGVEAGLRRTVRLVGFR
ncbi:hypothetical protein [Actinomadura verrucosospora]|uniref:Uncharacterized protein n=1 Tax=Actinomadura verrucosospora TaxID=46165 RepID=A0A7D4A622_ACTVE|nr:hypothetical protein [Actinomadura verrucosospora]QKG23425.1 hypothetical protein ACTIVE_5068 [Actinomadura verrucosospora]